MPYEDNRDALDISSPAGQEWAKQQAEAASAAMAEGRALAALASSAAARTGVYQPMALLRQLEWERTWPQLAPDGTRRKAAPALAPVAVTPAQVKHTSTPVRATQFKAAPAGGPGVFEGYLSVFDNVDSYNDAVQQGAFTKTLAEAETRRSQTGNPYLYPVLYQHNYTQPIGGVLAAQEDSTGLYIRAQLDLDTSTGRDAYSGLMKGYLLGLSIGYIPIRAAEAPQRVRRLLEVQLKEASVVTFPANPETWVSQVQ